MKLSITYQVVTPESAEDGDFAETGFIAEDDDMDLRKLSELALYAVNEGQWYDGYPENNYRTGAETTRSYHPKGLTESSQARVYRALKARGVRE